jgi:predicted nucleic acid-binding protein
MIVADTNVWVAYWTGESASDTMLVHSALQHKAAWMAPMIASELLSDPTLPEHHRNTIMNLPAPELVEGYWIRVGSLRAFLFARQMRPKLVDSMIAQLCIDHDATLVTRDVGFRRFTKAGLRLHK